MKKNQNLKPCPKHPYVPRYYSKTRGYSLGCSGCIKERSARYFALNRDKENYKRVLQKRRRRHNGNETPPHQAICAICQKEKLLIYDHCHKTGAFRGWICRGCNFALGQFGDTAIGVKRALDYLTVVSGGACAASLKETPQ